MAAEMVPAVETAAKVERLRVEFTIIALEAHGRRLAYLDHEGTSQKPGEGLDAIV